jgi:hypothetical protein
LPLTILKALGSMEQPMTITTPEAWKTLLDTLQVTAAHHVRKVTEGALIGAILSHGLNPDLAIISDDAGQFNVFLHALCWIHAERTLVKLIGFNDEHKASLEAVRHQVWEFYQLLKQYKAAPTSLLKQELMERFDAIFTQTTCFASLNHALLRLHRNKQELLLVLERPDVPLHNNLSEQDVREPVKVRGIRGPTRSDEGRRLRDTFASLKATCNKLGLSFYEYLKDRLSAHPKLPRLSDLMRTKARESRLHNRSQEIALHSNTVPIQAISA